MASKGVSFALVIIALVLWGSWANTYKISHKLHNGAPFETFFVGYSVASACCCLLASDSLNEAFWSEQRYFDIHFRMALVAGTIANFGKVCITAAIELTGMTVAIPLVLGIEIFLGTILLYYNEPSSADPRYLFSGVILIFIAVIFDVLFQMQAHKDRKILKRQRLLDNELGGGAQTSEHEEDSESKTCTGIIFAVISGFCLATWPVIYEIDEEQWKEFYVGFIISLGLTSVVTLPIMLWFRGNDLSKLNTWIFILGLIGGFMMSSSIYLMFASQEGLPFIVSMTIVRCSPVIGALWGILVWDELRGASKTAKSYVGVMFCLYIAAIVIIALSISVEEEMDEELSPD